MQYSWFQQFGVNVKMPGIEIPADDICRIIQRKITANVLAAPTVFVQLFNMLVGNGDT